MQLDDQKDRDAKAAMQDAIDAGSKSARAWLELGRLQSDSDELKKAAELNPRWAEPYFNWRISIRPLTKSIWNSAPRC